MIETSDGHRSEHDDPFTARRAIAAAVQATRGSELDGLLRQLLAAAVAMAQAGITPLLRDCGTNVDGLRILVVRPLDMTPLQGKDDDPWN